MPHLLQFKFGEIFVCRFPFTSGQLSKPRPALVLFDVGPDVIICRITSAVLAGDLNVPVQYWREAGLEKPSIVRLDRLVTAEKPLLIRQIGKLTAADADTIKSAWNRRMVLR